MTEEKQTAENELIVELSNVTKNYQDPASNLQIRALNGIDLQIRKGDFTSIIGPSGVGKSTLLNIIGGTIKPTTGNVNVAGYSLHWLHGEQLNKFKREITGFVWQSPKDNLVDNISLLENLILVMEIANIDHKNKKEFALNLLRTVGLDHRASHTPSQISGGEAQRAGIAIALTTEPNILLADEPTGELDTETSLKIIRALRSINDHYGTTILVVTHDHRFEKMSDYSYHMLDGKIVGYRRYLEISENNENPIDNRKKEEFAVIDKFGLVRIPKSIRENYGFNRYLQFVEDDNSGRVYLKPRE